MVGDRGRAVRAAPALVPRALLERERDRAVQLGVLARQEVVVDDLAQQRVAEAVEARSSLAMTMWLEIASRSASRTSRGSSPLAASISS